MGLLNLGDFIFSKSLKSANKGTLTLPFSDFKFYQVQCILTKFNKVSSLEEVRKSIEEGGCFTKGTVERIKFTLH